MQSMRHSVLFPRILAAFVLVMFGGTAVVAQDPPIQESPEKPDSSQSAEKSEPAEPVYVEMKTSLGEIVLELNREKAPRSVENFLHYVDERFYDGTIFHRVIANFMIQGGGFTPDMKQKRPTRPPVENEWRNGLKNVRGSVAMARTANPDSATCQFFINTVDNPKLDQPLSGGAGYAVFGNVVRGMETVDKIRAVTTTTKVPHQNVPIEPVVIESARRLSNEAAKKLLEEIEAADTPATNDTDDDASGTDASSARGR